MQFMAELSLADHTLAASNVPSCVATAICLLVTAHFLPEAESLACQRRLRLVSGYAASEPEVRKCMGAPGELLRATGPPPRANDFRQVRQGHLPRRGQTRAARQVHRVRNG